MKNIFVLALILFSNLSFGQFELRSICIKRAGLDSKVRSVTNEIVDHSLRIASNLFNSKEFQDSLTKRDFNYHNICSECDTNMESNRPRISGKRVLDSLFRKNEVSLLLLLKKVGKPPILGHCFGLGKTCPNTDYITSFYKNINCNMSKDLPFDYAYAVHLCHEYTHNVGYCHTYQVDDVAESVGWIAFYFINKWYHKGAMVP